MGLNLVLGLVKAVAAGDVEAKNSMVQKTLSQVTLSDPRDKVQEAVPPWFQCPPP